MTEHTRPLSPPLPPDPAPSSRRTSTTVPPEPIPRSRRTSNVGSGERVSGSRRTSMIALSEPVPPIRRTSHISPTRTSHESITSDSGSQASQKVARSRPTSIAHPPIIHQVAVESLPISQAVGTAVDQVSHGSNARIDPAVIAQITEAVTGAVMNNITNLLPVRTTQYPPTPSLSGTGTMLPDSLSESSMARQNTPPSPRSDRSKPRDSVYSPLAGSFSAGSPPAQPSHHDSDDISSDDARNRATTALGSRRPSKYAASQNAGLGIRQETVAEPDTTPRPTISEDDGLTAVEKAWKPLFEKASLTPRGSQFLRGIAMHVINNFQPNGGVVMTPAKLLNYLDVTRPDTADNYPWRVIFGGKVTCSSISRIYRELSCEHYFIQTELDGPPNLPCLTPAGFASFMTCLINAHPDHSFDRLTTTIKTMAISNADDPKERFPKEMMRRQLPLAPDSQMEQRIIASMSHDPKIQVRNSIAMPPPPAMTQRASYSRQSHSNAVDDEDLQAVPERRRNPYTSQPAQSRVCPDGDSGSHRDDGQSSRPSRQNSAPIGYASNESFPPEVRSGGRPRENKGPPLSFNNGMRGNRSPVLGTSHPRSEIGSFDSATQSTLRGNDSYYDERRHRRDRASTVVSTGSDEDPRGLQIPLRTTTSNTYDYNSMPPPLEPMPAPPMSFSSRRQPPLNLATSVEDRDRHDRRRSAHIGTPQSATSPAGWNAMSDDRRRDNYQSSSRQNGSGSGSMNH